MEPTSSNFGFLFQEDTLKFHTLDSVLEEEKIRPRSTGWTKTMRCILTHPVYLLIISRLIYDLFQLVQNKNNLVDLIQREESCNLPTLIVCLIVEKTPQQVGR